MRKIATLLLLLALLPLPALSQKQSGREKKQAAQATKLCKTHTYWTPSQCQLVAAHQIVVGMSGEMVRTAWGVPMHVNTTYSGNSVEEQWVYATMQIYPIIAENPPWAYVYFENGTVTSMQKFN